MNDYVSFAEYESLEFSSFEQTTSHAETTLKSAAELSTIEVPERQWAWQDWLPLGTASLLGGPPGAGKTSEEMLAELIQQKTSLQEENSFLIGELTEAKIELAELKMR